MGKGERNRAKREEAVEVQFESKMYLLFEMRDELTAALLQIDNVDEQQNKLAELILKEDEETKEYFSSFTKGLIESSENLDLQRIALTNKLTYLNEVIEVFETRDTEENMKMSKTIDIMVTYTINALGL